MLLNKKELRAQMKRQRTSLSAAERTEQNTAICQRVLQDAAFQQAKTVFCYCATAEELDTRPILEQALADGKRLCLPRTRGKGMMDACEITDLAQLKPAAYGILEPDASCAAIEPAQIDLCIVPCLAADTQGFRLGYGGGYYDRFLPRTAAMRMLLCADARVLEQIPKEPFDVSCDLMITESRRILTHEK